MYILLWTIGALYALSFSLLAVAGMAFLISPRFRGMIVPADDGVPGAAPAAAPTVVEQPRGSADGGFAPQLAA